MVNRDLGAVFLHGLRNGCLKISEDLLLVAQIFITLSVRSRFVQSILKYMANSFKNANLIVFIGLFFVFSTEALKVSVF